MSYLLEEYEMKVEMSNIHIDIKYPQILFYNTNKQKNNISIEARESINKLLVPPEIQSFYMMINEGLIQINDYGELDYTFPPHSYSYGVDYNYTIGFMNENLLNLYERSISYTRNSDWRYRAILIDMNSGKKIMADDFFNASAFHEYILDGTFKSNKKDFNIQSYFNYITVPENLNGYLNNTFINQKKQVEVLVIYGEGPEIVIYAELDEVIGMINPKYLTYLQ